MRADKAGVKLIASMAAEKVEAAVAVSVTVLCFVKVPVFISIIKVYLLTQVPSILNTVVT